MRRQLVRNEIFFFFFFRTYINHSLHILVVLLSSSFSLFPFLFLLLSFPLILRSCSFFVFLFTCLRFYLSPFTYLLFHACHLNSFWSEKVSYILHPILTSYSSVWALSRHFTLHSTLNFNKRRHICLNQGMVKNFPKANVMPLNVNKVNYIPSSPGHAIGYRGRKQIASAIDLILLGFWLCRGEIVREKET